MVSSQSDGGQPAERHQQETNEEQAIASASGPQMAQIQAQMGELLALMGQTQALRAEPYKAAEIGPGLSDG